MKIRLQNAWSAVLVQVIRILDRDVYEISDKKDQAVSVADPLISGLPADECWTFVAPKLHATIDTT
jgi:hypothetical protein